MSIYDRWYRNDGDKPCGEHSRGKTKTPHRRARLQGALAGPLARRAGPPAQEVVRAQGRRRGVRREGQDPAAGRHLRRPVRRGGDVPGLRGGLAAAADSRHRERRARRGEPPQARLLGAWHARPHPTGAPSIGDYPLRILARQPSIVQGWLAAIPLHPNTVRMVAATVTPVFTAAAEDGLIARNPLKARQVKLPTAVKTDVAAWSAEQVAAVADALPARWSALAALGAAIGMRQGELFALAVDDVDFLRRNVHVAVQVKRVGGRVCFAPTKNRKIRDVPVSARVIPNLAEHVRLYPPRRGHAAVA